MKQIPNLFTLLNLVAGVLAIIFILQTGQMLVTQSDEGAWVPQLPEKMCWGSICIGIAAAIDVLDAFVARLFKAESAMGGQLDSLADVVSFGVAPGLIIYQLLRLSFIQQENALDVSMWALAPAFIFPCAGAWRLARFNISTTTKTVFTGVPIPAAGIVVASLPLILFYNYFDLDTIILSKWFLYALILILSFLMVSKASFLSLKSAGTRKNLPVIVLVVCSVIAAIFLRWVAVPVVFVIYIVLSLAIKKQIT